MQNYSRDEPKNYKYTGDGEYENGDRRKSENKHSAVCI